MLVDSAFLLLVGIALAGLVRVLLNEASVRRFLTGSKSAVVLKSALLGIPLPLCSCSVVPVAYELRKSGLSRGGTTAFLVSTPETGVDSILLTYSLTDPLMTVARPITAFVTAMAAGLAVELSPWVDVSVEEPAGACTDDCCSPVRANANTESRSLGQKIVDGLKYAFGDLMDDLAPYLFIGYLLAGVAALLLGDQFGAIPETFRSGWGSYVGAVVVGLPLYICATSSTPLAAVLLTFGFSPGAVLVFLLVGPATNVASLTVVRKILKGRATLVYLAAIVVISILCGLVFDAVYSWLGYSPVYRSGAESDAASVWGVVSAVVFSVYVVYLTFRKLLRRVF
ncbi:MAG: SO_0444 family Cu/Zn efflux transporter [Candidatus Zixiibacteriota bacterium]